MFCMYDKIRKVKCDLVIDKVVLQILFYKIM